MTINDPTIELVPMDKLFTDITVQRDLDRNRAAKNAKEGVFLRAAVGVPKVSVRDDGSYHFLDGQHRGEMLQLAGYGQGEINCEVFRGLTLAEEARLFRLSNNSKSVSPLVRYKVRVVEKEPHAVAMHNILTRHGWTVQTTPTTGNFMAVRALEGIVSAKTTGGVGANTVADATIATLTAAYGHDPAGVRGDLVSGLGGVLLRHLEEIDEEKLIAALAEYEEGAEGLLESAQGMRKFRKGPLRDSIAWAIVNAYNKKVRSVSKKLPEWNAKAPKAKNTA